MPILRAKGIYGPDARARHLVRSTWTVGYQSAGEPSLERRRLTCAQPARWQQGQAWPARVGRRSLAW